MPFHGERLKAARQRANMTQRELAELCNLVDVQLSRYENGRMEPSLPTLEIIARHLQVSVDYLLGMIDDPLKIYLNNDIPEDEQRVLDAFRRDGWLGVARLSVEELAK